MLASTTPQQIELGVFPGCAHVGGCDTAAEADFIVVLKGKVSILSSFALRRVQISHCQSANCGLDFNSTCASHVTMYSLLNCHLCQSATV